MLGTWLANNSLPEMTVAEAARNEEVRAELQSVVDSANRSVSRAESIRAFEIIDSDFTEENGYLTPSLKLKRHVVVKDLEPVIEKIYSGRKPASCPRSRLDVPGGPAGARRARSGCRGGVVRFDHVRTSPAELRRSRHPSGGGDSGGGGPRDHRDGPGGGRDHRDRRGEGDRKSTRLNSSHVSISYAVFCLKTKK